MPTDPLTLSRRSWLKSLCVGIAGVALSHRVFSSPENSERIIEGGWQYALSEKHVPIVSTERFDDWLHISVKVKHPQQANHHISSIRIYNHARIELASQRMHTQWSEPQALFVIQAQPEDQFYAVSECNLHGLWFQQFSQLS